MASKKSALEIFQNVTGFYAVKENGSELDRKTLKGIVKKGSYDDISTEMANEKRTRNFRVARTAIVVGLIGVLSFGLGFGIRSTVNKARAKDAENALDAANGTIASQEETITDQESTIGEQKQTIEGALKSAKTAADEAVKGVDVAIKAAQDAKAAAENAYDAALEADSLVSAVNAYRLAMIYNGDNKQVKSALEAYKGAEAAVPAQTQAINAGTELAKVETAIEAALKQINSVKEENLTQELINKKVELEGWLVNSQNTRAASNKVTVVDASIIAEEAKSEAESAAGIALGKILEYAQEATELNEVDFDLAADKDMAKLVKGDNIGVVSDFVHQEYVGDDLTLYFTGKDGAGRDAVFVVTVDTKDSQYKYGNDNADKYKAEIKSLIKAQSVKSEMYFNAEGIGTESDYVQVHREYDANSNTTKISYVVLSITDGNAVKQDERSVTREGKFTESEALKEVAEDFAKLYAAVESAQ